MLTKKIIQALKLTVLLGFSAMLFGCERVKAGFLDPAGPITFKERELFFNSLALMMIVLIPVVIMSIAFIIRYRASHKTSEYRPNWSHSYFLEALWWGVPCAIIFILGVITWIETHKLDPYRKLEVSGPPLVVQAISLPWKWLFIYPEQNIATINFLELPVGRQIMFEITSDNEPMSALFIPQLGSQIYSMAAMRTELHVLATREGTFEGMNAMFNGDGFSDMHFQVKVVSEAEMQQWVNSAKTGHAALTAANYEKLTKPTQAEPVQYFSSVEKDLFKSVIQKYERVTGIPEKWDYNPGEQF